MNSGHSSSASHALVPPQRSPWVQRGLGQVTDATLWLPHLVRQEPEVVEDAVQRGADEEALEMAAAPREDFVRERIALEAQRDVALAEAERWRTHALAAEADTRQQGFAAGYAQGEAEGRAAGEAFVKAETQTSLNQFRQLAAVAEHDLRAVLTAVKPQLAELSVAIAQAIITDHFARHPERLADHLAAILERLDDGVTATVRLHPADLEVIRPLWLGVTQDHGWEAQSPRFIADEQVERAGCIIDTRCQHLDAQPATLLDLVRTAFAQVASGPDFPAIPDLAEAPHQVLNLVERAQLLEAA